MYIHHAWPFDQGLRCVLFDRRKSVSCMYLSMAKRVKYREIAYYDLNNGHKNGEEGEFLWRASVNRWNEAKIIDEYNQQLTVIQKQMHNTSHASERETDLYWSSIVHNFWYSKKAKYGKIRRRLTNLLISIDNVCVFSFSGNFFLHFFYS